MKIIKQYLNFRNLFYIFQYFIVLVHVIVHFSAFPKFLDQVSSEREDWDFEMGMEQAVFLWGMSLSLVLLIILFKRVEKRKLAYVLSVIFALINIVILFMLRDSLVRTCHVAELVHDGISIAHLNAGYVFVDIIIVFVVVSVVLAIGAFVECALKKKMEEKKELKLSKYGQYFRLGNLFVGIAFYLYLLEKADFSVEPILFLITGMPYFLIIAVIGDEFTRRGLYLANIAMYIVYSIIVYDSLYWSGWWSYHSFEYENIAGLPQYFSVVVFGAFVMIAGEVYKQAVKGEKNLSQGGMEDEIDG